MGPRPELAHVPAGAVHLAVGVGGVCDGLGGHLVDRPPRPVVDRHLRDGAAGHLPHPGGQPAPGELGPEPCRLLALIAGELLRGFLAQLAARCHHVLERGCPQMFGALGEVLGR